MVPPSRLVYRRYPVAAHNIGNHTAICVVLFHHRTHGTVHFTDNWFTVVPGIEYSHNYDDGKYYCQQPKTGFPLNHVFLLSFTDKPTIKANKMVITDKYDEKPINKAIDSEFSIEAPISEVSITDIIPCIHRITCVSVGPGFNREILKTDTAKKKEVLSDQ